MQEDTFWLYLNITEPELKCFLPAWGAYSGVIASPRAFLPKEDRDRLVALSPHLANLLRNKEYNKLEKELALESVRLNKFPHCISRLNCIYCWPDESTARLSAKYWGTQSNHFNEKYLTQIGATSFLTPTMVDTRWIDKYVMRNDKSLSEIGTEWIENYWNGSLYPWNGETNIPREPLMECLVDGIATIWNTELRNEAFDLIEKLVAPPTLLLLLNSYVGVQICRMNLGEEEWKYGQSCPFVVMKDGTLQLEYYSYMPKDLLSHINSKGKEAMRKQQHRGSSGGKGIPYKKGDSIHLPDLTKLNVNLNWVVDHPLLRTQLDILFPNLLVK